VAREHERARPVVELARYVLLTRPDGAGCDDWLGTRRATPSLSPPARPCRSRCAGRPKHLDVCPECAEEFRACLAALTEDGAR
jgi:hypothetical protein